MIRSIRPNGLIGESKVFQEMLAAIAKIASYDAAVLISGETGSGKELAARNVSRAARQQARESPLHSSPTAFDGRFGGGGNLYR